MRATAEYDAGAALIQMGDWQRATTVLENFRSAFPNHELGADVTTKLAVAYVEVGNSARAASEFERIADGDGPIEVKREALWRSAELYENDGPERRGDGGVRPVRRALSAARGRGRRSAAEAHRPRGRRAAITPSARAGCAISSRPTPRRAPSAPIARATSRRKSQLELATPTRDAFLGTRLVVPLDKSLAGEADAHGRGARRLRQGRRLRRRRGHDGRELRDRRALSRAQQGPVRVGAPAELTTDELEQYDILLEEQAFPFEEEAIELHETNAARTADGIYDEWVRKSLSALVELLPGRYAKAEIGETLVEAIR